MLYLSISLMKLITNNVLVSMGCRLFIFLIFLDFACIFAIPTQTHNSYGWYFSVSCQISTLLMLGHFVFLPSRYPKIIFNLKCWQLNPKIYPKDFIDFWFNCVRLLNHVKVTLSKPFTRGMKSVVSKLIGPMPLLCQCPPFAVRLLQGSNSVWLERTARFPHINAGCKTINKQT